MDINELKSLEVGTEICSWYGGPVYTVVSNHNGNVVAAQFARIEIVGEGENHEHYPWEIVERDEPKSILKVKSNTQ